MTSQDNDNITSHTQFWNRVQMIMILVVFAAPIVGAFLYKPKSYVNYGDIYQPVRPVANLTMTGESGDVEMDSLRRQWVFLVTADQNCDEFCEKNILKMRQLRFMQNQNMTRIRTVFLHTGLDESIAKDLNAKYSPVEAYSVPKKEYDQWTKILKIEGVPKEANQNRFYIIDPAGNLMLSYPATAEPSLIKKDIKRLLKASQIG